MLFILKWVGRLIVLSTVCAMWLFLATGNYAHGLQLAGASDWKELIAWASVGADVLKASMIIGIVAAFREKAWAALGACLVIWAATTLWSVRSGYGFISTTLSDSFTSRDKAATSYSDIKLRLNAETTKLDLLLKTEVIRCDTLKTRTERANCTNTRVSLADDTEKQRKAVKAVRAELEASTEISEADPVAAGLRRWVSADIKDEDVKDGTAMGFLLMLELCSNFGFAAIPPLLGFRRKEKASVEEEAPQLELRTELPPPAEKIDTPVVEPAQVQFVKRDWAVVVNDTPPGRVAMAKNDTIEKIKEAILSPANEPQQQSKIPAAAVAAFVAVLVAQHGPGARLYTADVQRDWTQYSNTQLDPATLGKALAQVGVVRAPQKDGAGRRVYVLPAEPVSIAA